jgi:hypothetical protein
MSATDSRAIFSCLTLASSIDSFLAATFSKGNVRVSVGKYILSVHSKMQSVEETSPLKLPSILILRRWKYASIYGFRNEVRGRRQPVLPSPQTLQDLQQRTCGACTDVDQVNKLKSFFNSVTCLSRYLPLYPIYCQLDRQGSQVLVDTDQYVSSLLFTSFSQCDAPEHENKTMVDISPQGL